MIGQAHRLPDELVKSLTWNRGKEMAQHKRLTLTTDVAVSFCDPQSLWQRGSNENTNGLLRHFPKDSSLSVPRRSAWTRSHDSVMDVYARRSASKLQPSVLKHEFAMSD